MENPTWSKSHQEALKVLLKAYEEKDFEVAKDCILCKDLEDSVGCSDCYWSWAFNSNEFGSPCVLYYKQWRDPFNDNPDLGIEDMRQNLDESWLATRIPMLKNAIKAWEEFNK